MVYKITALRVQKRNPQRVNVYLDGEFAFGVARIVAAWLQVGQQLSGEKIAQLKNQDEYEVAYQRALKLINIRPRTEKEIQQHLIDNKFPQEIADEIVSRLKDNRLVNDLDFASQWIANRSEFRPRGKKALQYELRQHGVPENKIRQALEQATIKENELAFQAAQKRIRYYQDLEWPQFRQKLGSYLARRGFSYEIISVVVERVWQEIQDHPMRISNNEEEEHS